MENLDSETYTQAILKMGYDALLADFNGENGCCAYQVKGEDVNVFYFYLPEESRNMNNFLNFSREIVIKMKELNLGERIIVGGNGHKIGKVVCGYFSRQMKGVDVENQVIELNQ